MNVTIIDPRMVIYDAPVIVRKEALLQRIADYVRQGYVFHVSGTVAVHKAPALAQKFRDYYRVALDRNARYRRKRLGQANAELLLYGAADTNADLVWVLLVTSGLHPAHQAERLKDARERGQRLIVTSYELVRQPRHGSSAAAWTWRIDGRVPLLVIDGQEISWEQFGRMLMSFEGWQFKLEIYDRSKEI